MQAPVSQIGSTLDAYCIANLDVIELTRRLASGCCLMRFESDETIFVEQTAADFVYRVIFGAARAVSITAEGQRRISAFYLQGQIFGLERGAVHHHSAEALVDSDIAVVRRSLLERAVAEDAAAASRLWGLSSQDLRRLQR